MLSTLPKDKSNQPLTCSDSELTSESTNPFRHLVGLPGWGIGLLLGLYPHRTAQHRKTQTYIQTSSGIRVVQPTT